MLPRQAPVLNSATSLSVASIVPAAADDDGAASRTAVHTWFVAHSVFQSVPDQNSKPEFPNPVHPWPTRIGLPLTHSVLDTLSGTRPKQRDVHYLVFWRRTAAVSTDLHGIPRPCPRRFTDNHGHSTGYHGASTGLHGHSTGFHEMPRQVAEHRGVQSHEPWQFPPQFPRQS